MDTINNDLTNLLQQMGVHQESLGITQRIIIIAGIIIIAFVADYFCRKIVVPTIKKLGMIIYSMMLYWIIYVISFHLLYYMHCFLLLFRMNP